MQVYYQQVGEEILEPYEVPEKNRSFSWYIAAVTAMLTVAITLAFVSNSYNIQGTASSFRTGHTIN